MQKCNVNSRPYSFNNNDQDATATKRYITRQNINPINLNPREIKSNFIYK